MLQKRKVSSRYVTRSDRCKHWSEPLVGIWHVGGFLTKSTDMPVAKIMVNVNHAPMFSILALSYPLEVLDS